MSPTTLGTDQAVYVISVAAELAGVHPQTLRNYERAGLVEPARSPGGTRRYSDADLGRVARINQLTDEGINMTGIKRILTLEAELADLHRQLDETRAALAAPHTERPPASHR